MESALNTRFAGTRRSRAFSLAEVMVVVVIIGFATTVAVVAYSGYRKDASVRSGAEQIKALLVDARTRAIANDDPTAVAFDLTNQAMWVDQLDDSLNITAPKVVHPVFLGPDVVIHELKINGVAYSTDLRRVTFQPDGRSPLVTVTLRRPFDDANVTENYYSVQLYPASAEPRVWPNERK